MAQGSFELHVGDRRRLHPGAGGRIRAQDIHDLVAAEPDSVWSCFFALRTLTGEVISYYPTEAERYDGV